MHVYHGNRHWIGAYVALLGESQVAVQQGNVRGGAAHIKGHQLRLLELFAQSLGGGKAAGRAG